MANRWRFVTDRHLIVLMWLFNAAGYDDENGEAFHPLRAHWRKMPIAGDLVQTLRRLHLAPTDYLRLANPFFAFKNQSGDQSGMGKEVDAFVRTKLIPGISQIEQTADFVELISANEGFLKLLSDYNRNFLSQTLAPCLAICRLDQPPFSVDVHINLLDSYSHGMNYYCPPLHLISASLGKDGQIQPTTIQHEYFHLLIKSFRPDIAITQRLAAPVEMKADDARTILEENLVLALMCLLNDDRRKQAIFTSSMAEYGYRDLGDLVKMLERVLMESDLSTTLNCIYDKTRLG